MAEESRIRVAVADNTRMDTELLALALKRESLFEVTTCEFDLRLLSQEPADVAVFGAGSMDCPLKGCEVARELRTLAPAMKVVLLVDEFRPEIVRAALRVPVRGIFSRSGSSSELSKCIRLVQLGQLWLGGKETTFLLEEYAASTPPRIEHRAAALLSSREKQVVQCVAEGLSNRESASRLQLSEHTIKNYLFRIFDKLGVASRAELIYYVFCSPTGFSAPAAPLRGVPSDETAKLNWCHEAALHSSAAQFILGEIYRDGRGTPKDPLNSYMWFMVAEVSSQGYRAAARKARLRLRAKLTPVELAEAERRAVEWMSHASVRPESRRILRAAA